MDLKLENTAWKSYPRIVATNTISGVWNLQYELWTIKWTGLHNACLEQFSMYGINIVVMFCYLNLWSVEWPHFYTVTWIMDMFHYGTFGSNFDFLYIVHKIINWRYIYIYIYMYRYYHCIAWLSCLATGLKGCGSLWQSQLYANQN